MKKNKHIGMWACPRSRSTVITRAFENLDGCVIYDEPFLKAYRWMRKEDFHREEAMGQTRNDMDKDYKKVIEKLTGDLPNGKTFSFQKLSTDEYLPEFGTEWISKLTNFFLIRHPKDILLSLCKVFDHQKFSRKEITEELVGIKKLHSIFEALKSMSGNIPLVISSDDIVKNPHHTLQWLCDSLGLNFNQHMLAWEPALKHSVLSVSGQDIDHDVGIWYENLRNSQTFLPYEKQEGYLPDDVMPTFEKCMPYYEALAQHSHIFHDKEKV